MSEGRESLLKCDHEEADDLTFHINHAVIIDQFQKVIVASADTDVFICLMYHFRHWSMYELEELWVVKGQGISSRAVPVHNLVKLMKSDVVDVLPAVHALSGCDTTGNGGTKKSALQAAEETGHDVTLVWKTFTVG